MSDQDLGITATYDPDADTLTCAPSSVTVFQHRTGKVRVTLQLKQGATGTIEFQNTPIQWTTPQPPGAHHQKQNDTTVDITVPHGNSTSTDASYVAQINCIYKKTGNPDKLKSANATVSLQGQQPFTVTSTYDPDNNTLTCSESPTPIKVNTQRSGKITVNIQLKQGASGTIKFQDDPLKWPTIPPFGVTRSSDTQTIITAPNAYPPAVDRSYSFQINYSYTKPNGEIVTDTLDPTIMLEGTGGMGQGHGQGQGQGHGHGS